MKEPLIMASAGSIWEGRLVKFVGVFAKRWDNIKLALVMHTTTGVDTVKLAGRTW
jgi:hypothetical protein